MGGVAAAASRYAWCYAWCYAGSGWLPHKGQQSTGPSPQPSSPLPFSAIEPATSTSSRTSHTSHTDSTAVNASFIALLIPVVISIHPHRRRHTPVGPCRIPPVSDVKCTAVMLPSVSRRALPNKGFDVTPPRMALKERFGRRRGRRGGRRRRGY